MKNHKKIDLVIEESNPKDLEVPLSMDRWVPTEGDSTDPLQNELYKLQVKMHLCTERYMKKKQLLREQFKRERDEVFKRYADKIQELEAPTLSPREKSKASSSGMSFLSEGEFDVGKGGVKTNPKFWPWLLSVWSLRCSWFGVFCCSRVGFGCYSFEPINLVLAH